MASYVLMCRYETTHSLSFSLSLSLSLFLSMCFCAVKCISNVVFYIKVHQNAIDFRIVRKGSNRKGQDERNKWNRR